MAKNEDTQPNISINTTSETIKGNYSNAVKVVVTDSEVIIDFAFIYPETDKKKQGIMTNRIIINQNLALILAESIKNTISIHVKKKKNNEKKGS